MKALLVGALTLGCVSIGVAQNSPPAPSPPYFAGIQTAGNWYEVYYSIQSGVPPRTTVVRPAMLMAGYQVWPRLTVQAAFGYRYEYSESPGSTGVTLTGQRVLDDAHWDEDRTFALPLMLRYAVLPTRNRLQVDVLAGFVWLHNTNTQESRDELDGQVTRLFRSDVAAHNFCASAGLGMRYAFGRHFEGVADLTYNRNLHDAPAIVHQYVSGNRWGLTHSLNLGLRYRFNLGKGKTTIAANPTPGL